MAKQPEYPFAFSGIPQIRHMPIIANAASRKNWFSFYGDYAPGGHDHLHESLLSGTLDLDLKICSPTIPGGQAEDDDGVTSVFVPSKSGTAGGAVNSRDVDIPVSSIKGMLSSAYETITASRMRVFGYEQNDNSGASVLAYRVPFNYGTKGEVKLVKVTYDRSDPNRRVAKEIYGSKSEHVIDDDVDEDFLMLLLNYLSVNADADEWGELTTSFSHWVWQQYKLGALDLEPRDGKDELALLDEFLTKKNLGKAKVLDSSGGGGKKDGEKKEARNIHLLLDNKGDILALLPACFGRRLYKNSPRNLAKKNRLLPARGLLKASEAERLFGFVAEEQGNESEYGKNAYAGHIRILPVSADEGKVKLVTETKELFLKELSSPKPSSGFAYLTHKDGLQLPSELGQEGLFTDDQVLTRKAYITHPSKVDPKNYGSEELPEDVYDPVGKLETGESKRRARVKSWISPGSVFRVRIEFTDISEAQLAHLLFLCSPDKMVDPEFPSPLGGFLKLGHGKPLGLGAVQLTVRDGGLQLTSGGKLAEQYRTLSGCFGLAESETGDPESLIAKHLPEKFMSLPHVQAFCQAATGFVNKPDPQYPKLFGEDVEGGESISPIVAFFEQYKEASSATGRTHQELNMFPLPQGKRQAGAAADRKKQELNQRLKDYQDQW